ncbi:glycosyltransferase family 4 protein [bacterium]|nr:glycosyltransferase family 4 protein [bacterium]
MRVCMVSYSVYQFDNRVHRYGSSLIDAGHQVDVLSLGFSGTGRTMYHGAVVYQLQWRRIDEKGPLSYLIKLLTFFGKVFFFLPVLQMKHRYDVIHFHNIPDFAVFSTIIPKLMGVPVVFDIHDLVPEFYARKFGLTHDRWIIRLLLRMERAACAYADHVITVTDMWKDKVCSRSVSPGKCTVILNAPYPPLFDRVPVRNRDSGPFSLLYHGALNEHFGVDIAVRAVAEARREIPDIRFDIFGRGREEDALKRIIRDLDLEDTVFIHRPVQREYIPGLIADSTIGIVPKRSAEFADEALSSKLLEFAYMEKPVAVSRTTASSHYFRDDQVLFFEAENVAACAEAIVRLYREPGLRKTLSERIAAFKQQHHWNIYFKEYCAVLRSVGGRARTECA